MTAIGRIATVWFDRSYPWSDLGLFSHLKSIVYLDPKIPDGALQLSVAQQQLYGPEILRSAVDERHLGSSHCVGTVYSGIEPDGSYPGFDDTSVLRCGEVL